MFSKIEVINMARAMTDHAAQRQRIVARNIANSDTPGFKAKDIAPFGNSNEGRTDTNNLRGTNPRHLTQFSWPAGQARVTIDAVESSPNGNTVSLEAEMVKTAELRQDHDLSLGIYRSALNILRTSIGRRT